jgi:hypothetical protein
MPGRNKTAGQPSIILCKNPCNVVKRALASWIGFTDENPLFLIAALNK